MADPTLLDGQAWIDGVTFGHPDADPVKFLAGGFDFGSTAIRAQDVPAPRTNAMFHGRDYRTPAVWKFALYSVDRTALAALRSAWRSPRYQQTDTRTRFFWRRDGVTRYVWGRPQLFDLLPADSWGDGDDEVTATFQLSYDLAFDPAVQQTDLSLVSTSGGGLKFPAKFPWTFVPTRVRSGVVTIPTGSPLVPATIVMRGPKTGQATMTISAGTWKVSPANPLLPGQVVTVDGLAGTAMYATGANCPLVLGSTRRPVLAPGTQELAIASNDKSFSASAQVTWHNCEYL